MFTDTLCDNKILLFGQVEGNAHKYTDNKVWEKKAVLHKERCNICWK